MPPRKASRGTSKSTATPKKRVAANGFKLPDPIPSGQIITDVAKNDWVLGKSIGQGGFGEIYLASDDISRRVSDTDKFVVKVEPHSNGPLFTEMHCYMRIAKPELIEAWMKENKLKRFGMPKYLGSGSFEYKSQKYRFMVMERFGSDLQKILEQHSKKFSFKTVYQLGLEIIDVLEYIHDKGYIHADIKASNLLVGYQKGTENQVFLVDYGLACRYAVDGVHKEYKYDGRKAHDGTIEFTSRDAHIGAHSRRGDLEILGYNMTQWLCARLPWEDNLTDCDYVAKSKRWYMEHVDKLMVTCFPDGCPPGLQEFLTYVAKLTFDEKPNYEKCRQILRNGLVKRGYKDDGKLVFMSATPKQVSKKPKSRLNKRGVKRRRSEEEENLGMTPNKFVRTSPRSPCKSTTNRINTRLCPRKSLIGLSLSTATLPKMQFTDPEDIIIEKENEKMLERQRTQRPKRLVIKKDTSLDNPTPQMLALMAKRREKSMSPPICMKRHKHRMNCVMNTSGKASPTFDDLPTDLTYEMENVIRRRAEREAAERSAKTLARTAGDVYSDNDSAIASRGASDGHHHHHHQVTTTGRRNSRLQEPVTPTIRVEDLENSNDAFFPDECVTSNRLCASPPPIIPTNNNTIKLGKHGGIRRREVADLLDVATRAVATKRIPAIVAPSTENTQQHCNTTTTNTTPAMSRKSSSSEDPYEFIDDLAEEYSPTSYKEFTIRHSPSKVRKRLTLVRAAKIKKNRPLRKSARISTLVSLETAMAYVIDLEKIVY